MELNIPSTADFKKLEAKVDKIITMIGSDVKPHLEGWMKSAEAKRILKCSDSTLKNYRDSNLIEWKKVGGTYYHLILKTKES